MERATGGILALAAAAALFAHGAPTVSAQQPRAEQIPSFRSGVEVVSVDVGVVDKQGLPVRGLTPTDFVVSVAGQTRRVVTAEFIDRQAAQAASASRLDATPVSTNEGTGVGRLFAFIVDQNTLDLGGARRVAGAAGPFFSRLTFADRSALMLMPVGPSVSFTWAHDRVREGLQRVTGMGRPVMGWEYGSLADARDITNRNFFALRSIGERECGAAAATGFGGPVSPSGVASAAPAPTPSPSGGTPAGGPAPSSTPSPTPAPSNNRAPSPLGSFGVNSCTREIQMQAESTWRSTQMTSQSSISSMRQFLGALGQVPGDKTVILISGGWPMDDRDEMPTLMALAADAAAARATIYTIYVPTSSFSADRRLMTTTPLADSYLHYGPLETLASLTGGSSFRAEVGADAAFERLGRELSGYYRIGIEKDPTDADGKDRHMKVQVTRTGATVRAREVFDVHTYADRDWAARMGAALEGPVPATEIPVRVTNYVSTDYDDTSRLKLLITGEASRVQSGDATLRVLVSDLQGKRITGGEMPLAHENEATLPFSTNISVAPGSYIVRVAIMDSAGHVGSVDHRADVGDMRFGGLSATGPVFVRVPGGATGIPRLALDSIGQDERLALEIDLEGDASRLETTDVEFEIAASADGPALVRAPAAISRSTRDNAVVAQGMADMRVLPAGTYVVRARVTSSLQLLGEMRRGISVIGSARVVAPAATPATTVVTARPAAAHGVNRLPMAAAPRFTMDEVLAPQVLATFLDRVAARPDASSPAVRQLLDRARTSGLSGLNVSDALAKDAPVAAFLKGLTLLAEKQIEPAADQFRNAMRGSVDFPAAMIYLGACYAAGGKDKEAAGAWRTALIREGDAAPLHIMLADAQLRQGRWDLAIDDLTAARTRWPDDQGLKRRFAVAALLSGQRLEGVRALDELIDKQADDEPSLTIGLLVLYDAFESRQPIESIDLDRARMLRFADTYRARGGSSMALVDTWVASANRRQ